MRCLGKNIILEIGERDKVSKGGIHLPGQDIDTDVMTVYMVGPDVTKVKVGDTVTRPDVKVISTRQGVKYDIELPDNGHGIIVEEDDIRVVIEDAPELVEAIQNADDGDAIPVDDIDQL